MMKIIKRLLKKVLSNWKTLMILRYYYNYSTFCQIYNFKNINNNNKYIYKYLIDIIYIKYYKL